MNKEPKTPNSIQLRDYQQDAIEKIRFSYSSGKNRVMYVLPTGGGKTIVFCKICELAALKGSKTIIFVHRKELYVQTLNALYNNIPYELFSKIKVSMIQTASKLNMDNYNFAIFDEAHHISAKTYRKVLNANKNMKVLGVTATPSWESASLFDEVIYGPSVSELIDSGYLSKYAYFCPKTFVNEAELIVKVSDYDTSQITTMLSKNAVYGNVVKIIKDENPDKSFIIFCSTIEHCKKTLEGISAHGITARLVTGDMKIQERKENLKDLSEKKIQCVVSCDAISEGVDVPSVDACILLRPTLSRTLYIQQVGRVLRPHPDKEKAYIYDLVANVMRHGLPDSPPPELKPKNKKKDKKETITEIQKENVKICKSCYLCYSIKLYKNQCPSCGYIEKPKAKKITVKDDEVVEINKEIIKPELWQPSWDIPGWRHSISGLDTKEKLYAFAKYKNYKKGWVYHILKKRGKI